MQDCREQWSQVRFPFHSFEILILSMSPNYSSSEASNAQLFTSVPTWTKLSLTQHGLLLQHDTRLNTGYETAMINSLNLHWAMATWANKATIVIPVQRCIRFIIHSHDHFYASLCSVHLSRKMNRSWGGRKGNGNDEGLNVHLGEEKGNDVMAYKKWHRTCTPTVTYIVCSPNLIW